MNSILKAVQNAEMVKYTQAPITYETRMATAKARGKLGMFETKSHMTLTAFYPIFSHLPVTEH